MTDVADNISTPRSLRPSRHGWLAPSLVLLLLACVGFWQHRLHRPDDWSGYHARAGNAVATFEPEVVMTNLGQWVGYERPADAPAYPVRPAIAAKKWEFLNFSAGDSFGDTDVWSAELDVVVASRDVTARSYWPTLAAPARGGRVIAQWARTMTVGGRSIDGTEFRIATPEGQERRCFGFIAIAAGPEPTPGGGRTTGSIDDVFAGSGEDHHYKHRRRGASVVLVRLDPALSAMRQGPRDEVLRAILEASSDIASVLLNDLEQPSRPSRVLPGDGRVQRPRAEAGSGVPVLAGTL